MIRNANNDIPISDVIYMLHIDIYMQLHLCHILLLLCCVRLSTKINGTYKGVKQPRWHQGVYQIPITDGKCTWHTTLSYKHSYHSHCKHQVAKIAVAASLFLDLEVPSQVEPIISVLVPTCAHLDSHIGQVVVYSTTYGNLVFITSLVSF